MRGAVPRLPQYIFMAWCLGKHRDFTLPYLTLMGVWIDMNIGKEAFVGMFMFGFISVSILFCSCFDF
jgi:hypothetical protein